MAKRYSRVGMITVCVIVAVLLIACVILVVEDMWAVPIVGPAKSSSSSIVSSIEELSTSANS